MILSGLSLLFLRGVFVLSLLLCFITHVIESTFIFYSFLVKGFILFAFEPKLNYFKV